MIKFLLLSLFLGLFTKVHAQILISGYDDVLRQADNTSFLRAAIKFLEEDKGFAGMPLLYQKLLHRSGKKEFVLLSAIPSLFESRVKDFLKKEQYPSSQLILRNIFTQWSAVNFKMQVMEEFSQSEGEIILVLDNSEASIEFAERMRKVYQDRVSKIYLRQTELKSYSPDITPFITTFDIALSEAKKGRLSRRDVDSILATLLSESQDERIIPSYAYCPVTYDPCGNDIFEYCPKLSQKVQAICTGRLSKERK